MVFRRRRPATKHPRRKARLMRKRMAPRRPRSVGNKQVAHTTESYEVEDITPNTLYSAVFDMSYFPRSSLIGQNYQEYKINKLELKFEPFYNTFQESTALGADTLPQLLTYVDRTGRDDIWNKANLEELGSKPHKFTSNTIRSYKPNTLAVVQNNAVLPQSTNTASGSAISPPPPATTVYANTQSSQVVFNKWYSTAYDCDAANIPQPPGTTFPEFAATAWYGMLFWIDQASVSASTNVGRLTVTASISFRGAALSKTGSKLARVSV